MSTDELVKILNEHKDIGSVKLASAKDCQDFWAQFTESVYMHIPADESGTDCKVENLLDSFANVDTLEVVNKKGKILKRFAQYWKNETGSKLPDNIMGIIGDVLQGHLNMASAEYFYDFTDVIDWQDGQFGKSKSCWWGDYSDSRDVFTDNGGWGIRFYESTDDENGIGRTWILPREGMLIGFNSYGVSRPQTSKVIKAIFAQHGIKLHYKQASVRNSFNSEIPYVNGDSGFILYPDDMNSDSVPDEFDLNMNYDSSDVIHCVRCNCRLDVEYDNYEHINDEYYCGDCAYDTFSLCDKCGEWYDKDDVYRVEHRHYEYLCEYCAKREELTQCYECGEWKQEIITDSDGDSFCTECADKELTFCDHCDEYFYQDSHAGNCPKDYDFTGLVESHEENFHALLRTGTQHTATVYRVAGCDGITLFNPHSINSELSDEWNILHDVSGLAIKSGLSFVAAKRLLIALSDITDWNRPSDDLVKDSDLMNRVYGIIRDITQ